jgi:hypothetical protein
MAATIPAEDIATRDLASLGVTTMRLDLIITVDTMVAHLAGALGAPVWTMLPPIATGDGQKKGVGSRFGIRP